MDFSLCGLCSITCGSLASVQEGGKKQGGAQLLSGLKQRERAPLAASCALLLPGYTGTERRGSRRHFLL